MILRLNVPFVDPSLHWVRVGRWCMADGDRVGWGDVLCELLVEECDRLYRDGRPGRLAQMLVDPSAVMKRKYLTVEVDYRLAIRSSDVGYLRVICAAEDQTVEVGGVLAVLSTGPEEVIDEKNLDSWGIFRVVPSLINPSEGE